MERTYFRRMERNFSRRIGGSADEALRIGGNELPNVVKRHDGGKQDEKSESRLMDPGFGLQDPFSFHAAQRSEERHNEEPPSVQGWERKEIERSQIDGKKRRDYENDLRTDVRLDEFYEKASDRDRPTDAGNGLRAFGRSFGKRDFSNDLKQEFEREARLRDGFFGPCRNGLRERHPILERLVDRKVGIRHVGTDFPFFRKDRKSGNGTAPGNFELYSVSIGLVTFYDLDEFFRSGDFTSFDRNQPVALPNSGSLGGTSVHGSQVDSGDLEYPHFNRLF